MSNSERYSIQSIKMAMNNLGEFALIIGDIHIPQRATDIPEQFKDLLVPNKMQYVLSPGNVGSREVSKSYKHLQTKSNNFLLSILNIDSGMVGEPCCS